MVAQNPLLATRMSLRKKFNATVINDIWPEVVFFSLIAMMVHLVNVFTDVKLYFSNQLLTVLGTVLGLVISFRTSSAYERYQDGRKMWTNISTASRNIAQMFWVHVSNDRPEKDGSKLTPLESVIEKKTMVNLVQAFSVSVKHFLRGESGVYYQDLYPLICFLPRYAAAPTSRNDVDMLPLWHASEEDEHPFDHDHQPTRSASPTSLPEAEKRADTPSSWYNSLSIGKAGKNRPRRAKTFDPEKALPTVNVHRPLKPARNPPNFSLYDYLPILMIFKPITRLFRRGKKSSGTTRTALGRKIKPQLGDSNVPLEITLVLSNYTAYLMKNGLLQPSIAAGLVTNIGTLQDTLSNLERIGNTPLPFAYQAHLRMSLWIYLFFLPFQIYQAFGVLSIPGTAFASFLLLGFLEIGQEIENPFNYDLNDLDLDGFCLTVQRELHEITAYTAPDPSSFVFSPWNQPFAPADRRTADDIMISGDYKSPDYPHTQPGMDSIRKTLLKSWREVDVMTRH